MPEELEGRKIGEGHLAGMARMGLKELAQALPAFTDSVRPVEEPGVFGNPTQQMVTQEMGAGYQAMLNDYVAQSPPEQEMDRGGMER
jgi:hypothetical protein